MTRRRCVARDVRGRRCVARARSRRRSTSVGRAVSISNARAAAWVTSASVTSARATASCAMDSARARARAHRARVNRALYRAKQRGFLELDIVVGEWASREMGDPATTSEAFLDAFDEVLDAENPDLFKWLTGQAEAPREVRENEAYASLARHCKKIFRREERRGVEGGAWEGVDSRMERRRGGKPVGVVFVID